MSPEEFQQLLNRTADTCESGDVSFALRGTVPAFHNGFGGNFVRREDPQGITWAPHAPLTIRLYGIHPLLILSGAMMAAAADEGSPGNITRVADGGRTLELGISGGEIPYAWQHQAGTDRIPRREFLYASEETVDNVVERFADDMQDLLFGWQLTGAPAGRQAQPVG